MTRAPRRLARRRRRPRRRRSRSRGSARRRCGRGRAGPRGRRATRPRGGGARAGRWGRGRRPRRGRGRRRRCAGPWGRSSTGRSTQADWRRRRGRGRGWASSRRGRSRPRGSGWSRRRRSRWRAGPCPRPGGRRPARGPTRTPGCVERVQRGAEDGVGRVPHPAELGRVGLADDDASGRPHAGDEGVVGGGGRVVGVERRSIGRGVADGVLQILDARWGSRPAGPGRRRRRCGRRWRPPRRGPARRRPRRRRCRAGRAARSDRGRPGSAPGRSSPWSGPSGRARRAMWCGSRSLPCRLPPLLADRALTADC